MLQSPIKKFIIAQRFSLGAGSHHRWYDVMGTITFTFKSLDQHNPRYAFFGSCLVHPQEVYTRAMEHWKRMNADGLGERQEWRVQNGYEGEMRVVRLPRLVVAREEGVWCDWREMFDAYFAFP